MDRNTNTVLEDPNIAVNRNISVEENRGIRAYIYQQYVFVYSKTLWTERFRLEHIAIFFAAFCSVIFSIVALATPITHFEVDILKISITGWDMRTCIQSDCQFRSFNPLCTALSSSTWLFVFMVFIHLCSSILVFVVFGLMVFGRVLFSIYFGIASATFSLIIGLVATLSGVSIVITPLCNDTSLYSMGFEYGPALVVLLTDILLLGLTVIFYFARCCCCRRPRYFTS
ncbi:hypothetical protein LSM04_002825 [Trypanosoma melophagium]|uniref:uncharacterized protein n=1 Tax=Trypanosoma melophagium TaxID=715481 RepID=UPI00351A9ED8|nr:hypothetical protein LSM04_002825 [Trypanosoma melophagium]